MKKQIVRLIALLIFASVAMSSCSVEYRERHHRHHMNDDRHERYRNHDRDYNRDNDNHYRNYNDK
jgi:hypothetical protein